MPNFSINETPINPYHEEGKVTFAIVNICILQSITECQITRDIFRKHLAPEEMKTCLPKHFPAEPIPEKSKADICEENYKTFDAQIYTLIDYIIRKEIQCIEDSKGFLCCQKNDLTQKIMKLISCDFNVRVPTKNSTEFAVGYLKRSHLVLFALNKCYVDFLEFDDVRLQKFGKKMF